MVQTYHQSLNEVRYWYLDHQYRVHVFEFEFKKWVLNYSLSILQFHFVKSRHYLGITRVTVKMASTGCIGDYPKYLFCGVAQNNFLTPEEESFRRDGESQCSLQNLFVISDKSEQCVNVLSSLYVYETKNEEYEDGTFSSASMD